MDHEGRKKLLHKYLAKNNPKYSLNAEKEYPRYSIFRVLEDVTESISDTTQYQIFKDGTIMRNCREVFNWRQSEALLKA